jgi:eukaryotic-like serine/threonine-protein kinase
MTLAAGTKLGRYEIISQIGAGGMGEVYLAEDTSLHRKVALKVLPAELATQQDRMRRFKQEATSAASLNHPNIAHIYEIDESDGTNFIAMEYVAGTTLREKIRHERDDLEKLLRVLQHVAEGLAKAHAAGIVHRDLKPDNVMISHDGHAKILDFGLAKLIETQSSIQSTEPGSEVPTIIQQHSIPGLILGTMGYMSPEQAQGKTSEIDHRSDIFSFGCILFEAVTGHRAFAGKDSIESLNKIIREPAPPIASFNISAPADLQRIVRRCLAKDPDERYQTIKDVAIELKELRRELQDHPQQITRSRSDEGSEAKTLWDSDRTVVQNSAASTGANSGMTRASSAEFIVTGIKQHKIASLVIACVVLLVVTAGAFGIRSYLHARTTEVAVDSVAVIPFINEAGDLSAEWISDGLTESVINSLTQLPNLKVIARSSVFRYKGKGNDPLQVGKELGVRAVLTGRLMQRGDSVVISAELIDIRDNKQLWGDKYERKLADMLSVQRDIAREITNNLRPTLSGAEKTKANKQYTANPEAYQLYLKGRFYWNKRTVSDFEKALQYFQEAVDKDPSYALAYSGLADTYALLTAYGPDSPNANMPKAKAAALRALELDDTLAEAHASMGEVVEYSGYDFETAEREYRKSIELNPNYATAHQWLAENLSARKRFDEAIVEIRRALDLDPLSLIMNRIYADILVDARRIDEAIDQYRKTLELDPNFPTTNLFLGRAYEQKGLLDQAVAFYTTFTGLTYGTETANKLNDVYQKRGWKAYLQAELEQLTKASQTEHVPPFVFATQYARVGRHDDAIIWLEKAYAERDFRMCHLSVSFEFDGLRQDPRFIEMLKKIGLPQ